MKKLCSGRIAGVSFILAALVCLLEPYVISAQQATPPPPPRRPAPSNQPGSVQQVNRTESVNQRALDLEMLSTVGRRDRSEDSINKRLATRLIGDFERIRQINSETITPLLTTESIDYKKLSKATAEIKDRATRIKYTIALPLGENKDKGTRYDADSAKFDSMLPELDRLIKSFLENPVFYVNSPNDADYRSAAARDLEAIIKLSQAINKIAKTKIKSSETTN